MMIRMQYNMDVHYNFVQDAPKVMLDCLKENHI